MLNGCGVVGMAHLTVTDNDAANYAAVIPVEAILKLVLDHFDNVKFLSECPPIKIVTAPVLPFVTACGKMASSFAQHHKKEHKKAVAMEL